MGKCTGNYYMELFYLRIHTCYFTNVLLSNNTHNLLFANLDPFAAREYRMWVLYHDDNTGYH